MSATPASTSLKNPEVRRGVVVWIAKAAVGWIAYAAILLLAAGNIRWGWGWVFLIVLGLSLIAHPLLLVPRRPDLLAERARGMRSEGVQGWDKWLTAVGAH
ncbi:MAG: hypothetical protein R3C44_14595 [Chloroflexota bacterium]